MVPGSPDLAAWLAHELSLRLMEDGPDGSVRSVVGPGVDEDELVTAVLAATGLDEHRAAVVELIERARAGAPGSMAVPEPGVRGRILAWTLEPGRARVLVAPHAEVVARRAAAADLAAGVTHEVANALTAIAGWTRMASSSGPLPERTRQALDVVQRSARDALGAARGLLGTMRDTSSPSGHSSPSIPPSAGAPVDVGVVVAEVVETLRPELAAGSIRLLVAVEDGVEAIVPAPTVRLIVSNLVRNAFEALSPGGSIRVELTRMAERAILIIDDDGPGMDAATLALVFERYYTTKESGTGLGLALVRDAVHDAGGSLALKTHPGQGTRFEIRLPLADSEASARPSTTPHTSHSGIHPRPFLHGRRVLVVDDDAAMRSLVRTALELQGALVDDAESAAEVFELTGSFDVALLDVGLRDGRGDQVLAELRRTGRVQHAIVMTGSVEPSFHAEGRPDAVLRKPFELDDLHRLVESVLDAETREVEGQ